MVQFDPDAWKTFLYERLTTAPGGTGAMSFFGKNAGTHEMLGLHLAAEYSPEPITLRGVTFDKWQKLPHDPDNHLLDCFVGCALAASVQKLKWEPAASAEGPLPPAAPPARQKIKLSDLYYKKHGRD
jgi:phage terminase large subunit GpA-like protein